MPFTVLVGMNLKEGRLVLDNAIQSVMDSISSLPKEIRLGKDDEAIKQIKEKARITARRFFYNYCGKKPQTRVHLFHNL